MSNCVRSSFPCHHKHVCRDHKFCVSESLFCFGDRYFFVVGAIFVAGSCGLSVGISFEIGSRLLSKTNKKKR